MSIAPNSHTALHEPYPVHPYVHAFGPLFGLFCASLQSLGPTYSYTSLAFSQSPAHLTNATYFVFSAFSTPMTSLIFAATASPPTGHADGGISPFAMAAASPSHPGYPHPPQLFPGRSSLTAISFSSTSTLNFSPATPRRIPITIPTPATTATAINIPVIYAPSLYKS